MAAPPSRAAPAYTSRVEFTTSRLEVQIKSRDDGDVYTCRAYNDVGEALDAVTLAIACKYLLNIDCPLQSTQQ